MCLPSKELCPRGGQDCGLARNGALVLSPLPTVHHRRSLLPLIHSARSWFPKTQMTDTGGCGVGPSMYSRKCQGSPPRVALEGPRSCGVSSVLGVWAHGTTSCPTGKLTSVPGPSPDTLSKTGEQGAPPNMPAVWGHGGRNCTSLLSEAGTGCHPGGLPTLASRQDSGRGKKYEGGAWTISDLACSPRVPVGPLWTLLPHTWTLDPMTCHSGAWGNTWPDWRGVMGGGARPPAAPAGPAASRLLRPWGGAHSRIPHTQGDERVGSQR